MANAPTSRDRKLRRPAIFAAVFLLALALGQAAFAGTETIKPVLDISIPGVSFSGTQVVMETDACGVTTSRVSVPWIAQVIRGYYAYAIIIAGLLAAVMMMWGGFQWLTSAGDASKVGAAKQRIENALIGLVLVFGAYVILDFVNPNLVALRGISVPKIERVNVKVRMYGKGAKEKLSPDPAIVKAIVDACHEQNIDPCVMLAICAHESGLKGGQFNGDSRDAAVAAGPCMVPVAALNKDQPLDATAKTQYPDYPGTSIDAKNDAGGKCVVSEAERHKQIANWLIANNDKAVWLAVAYYKQLTGGSSTVTGIVNYAAASVPKAKGCVPAPIVTSITVASAVANHMQAAQALVSNCVEPWPDLNGTCKGGGFCQGKPSETGVHQGTCTIGGAACQTLNNGEIINYVFSKYKDMAKLWDGGKCGI